MNITNLAFAETLMETENDSTTTKELEMPEDVWDYLVTEMQTVFRFSRKETKWFRNCKTAKLIATIPFAAGCDEPERTAIAHLCIYMAEIRGFQKYYAHLPSDDINLFKRLDFISTFEGGNPNVIEHGMNLLAFAMIEGYHKSETIDRKKYTYNPFVSGTWNYENLRKILKTKIDENNYDKLTSFIDGTWV